MLSAGIKDVASPAWGLPSFPTPEHICSAVANALANDPDIGKYALPKLISARTKAIILVSPL